ncbi:efflux RND transporter permease subunit [Leucothrix arctica]|uniref:AcrB/AcrD/AcrF family protein n=1 Tax=Leucothrix arctica TaxID=1481894 RepID=A0A317CHC9_9GAMM|nr:efflux RND transporter permease subunit [Leucothrix arctica]PWQ97541.1 AcrB/AcrD/AcrF family protein [Leucothrix arctica]
MIRFFAEHPTASNILMVAIVAVGLATLPGLNKETFPALELNTFNVTAVYPGASTADVEEAICTRFEDATDGISFVDEQTCEARDNLGVLTLTMQEGGDIKQFEDDIISAVDTISDFPSEVEDPTVVKVGRTDQVVDVAITSEGLTASELKALAEDYRNRLLAIPGVPIVKVQGFSTHQLNVLIDANTMLKYRLSIQNVASLIQAQAVDLPAGTINSVDKDYQIRFSNARKTVEELADLVILNTDKGGEVRLGDIARVVDRFDLEEERIEFNGQRAAILQVSKNRIDDTIKVFDSVKGFVDLENEILPSSTKIILSNDRASVVNDRLQLLSKNAWQGLILASFVLFLFFTWRYTMWIALGLPVSFLGGLAMMSWLGVSINMISMVALLMAIGILMDDAIVLSESIAHEYKKTNDPQEAVIVGTQRVIGGVFSSFLTSALLFGSLLFMKGDIGQVLGVLPVVLLSVLTVSLLEAFLVLPHHLKHALEHAHEKKPMRWRVWFEDNFLKLRNSATKLGAFAIRFRYATVGIAIGLLIISIGMIATGNLKFKAFPSLEGNILEARILLAQGAPLAKTESVVDILLKSLEETQQEFADQNDQSLVKNIKVSYNTNADSSESGTHIATISVDFLETEFRNTTLREFIPRWRENTGDVPIAISMQFKEPSTGPAGRAIDIRLIGNDLDEMSKASWDIQNWLSGYDGVYNLTDNLRPGKPQFTFTLKPGALSSGVTSQDVASQLRAAYEGVKVDDIFQGREAYEIQVKMDNQKAHALADFDNFMIITSSGDAIPLDSLVIIEEKREYARIGHVNRNRVINVYGDIDAVKANTTEVLADLTTRFLPEFKERFPSVTVSLEGEVASGKETNSSMLVGFVLALLGVYLLLSLQFKNYREPLLVMINIPLALIGVIWGHIFMGLDFTMPSMIGFVSLAGIVVNDSILLVEFVKYRSAEGMSLHEAATQAVHDRFRAVFMTSVTTVAGMMPLLFETSLQAQILVPLVTSVVFGMMSATLLVLLVLPALYGIMEDIGFVEIGEKEPDETQMVA